MFCSVCGNVEMVRDTVQNGGEEAMVCPQCGVVATEAICQLESSSGFASDSFIPENFIQQKYPKRFTSTAHTRWKQHQKFFKIIEGTMKEYTADKSLIDDTKLLFVNVVRKSYIHCHFERKTQVLVACVFLALQNANVPVLLKGLCSLVGIPPKGISKRISEVAEVSGMSKQTKEVSYYFTEIETCIKALPCMADKNHLASKAMEILQFLHKLSLTPGQDRTMLAMYAAYLAVISERKSEKVCATFRRFYRENTTESKDQERRSKNKAFRLHSHIVQRLLILIQRLPWMKDTPVAENRYHVHVDDLLRHQDYVIATVMSDGEARTSHAEAPRPMFSGFFPSKLPRAAHFSEREILELPPPAIGLALARKRTTAASPPPPPSPDARTKRRAPVSEDVHESDLSDGEANMYIRSASEVELLVKLRERATERRKRNCAG